MPPPASLQQAAIPAPQLGAAPALAAEVRKYALGQQGLEVLQRAAALAVQRVALGLTAACPRPVRAGKDVADHECCSLWETIALIQLDAPF